MMTTSSTVCSTSCSRWLETRIVLPSCAEVAQEAAQPADALGVQAVRGLVEDEHLRVAEQGGGQAEALAHAHAVLTGALAGGRRDAGELEQLVDPASGIEPASASTRRWSRPLRPGWKFVASRAAPTVDCGAGRST